MIASCILVLPTPPATLFEAECANSARQIPRAAKSSFTCWIHGSPPGCVIGRSSWSEAHQGAVGHPARQLAEAASMSSRASCDVGDDAVIVENIRS